MTTFYIHLQINRPKYYNVGVPNALNIKVINDEPYDKLSKRFNRYIHEIEYKKKPYSYKEYILKIDDPNAYIYKYILYFNNPKHKIKSVDIYFPSDDKARRYPLIFGLNYDDIDSVYFTYWHLIKITHRWYGTPAQIHSLPKEGSFGKDDLLTRLLEELGLYTKTNKDKLVIMVNFKPDENKTITYPRTGPNKMKITVNKVVNTPLQNFDKYTHSIINPPDISGFYIGYLENSIFVELNRDFKKLTHFHVFYNSNVNNPPLIFVLDFNTKSKLLKYSDFTKNLNESKLTINVKDLQDLDNTKLNDDLKKENDTVIKSISISAKKSPSPKTKEGVQRPVTHKTTQDPRPPSSQHPHRSQPPQVKKPLPINIDVSKKSGSTYPKQDNITVSQKNTYNDCNLFCYYTHHRVDSSSFTISSFISSSDKFSVSNLPKEITNVKSVIVYFNYYDENTPIMIEILYDGLKTDYYEVSKSGANYTITQNNSITKGLTLTEKLIELNDKNNGMFTFQIDKTANYNSINVSSDQKTSHYFTAYRHNLNGMSPNWSFVLFQRRLLVVDPSTKTPSINIQNKKYESVNVYVLNIDYAFPLLVELRESSSKSIFFSRKDSDGTFKKLEDFERTHDADIKNKLIESYYFFKKSVILDVSKSYDIKYRVRLIENKPQSNSLDPLSFDYASSKISSSFHEISVKQKKINCSTRSFGSFKCYQHDLSVLKQTPEFSEIAGLRLYLSQSNVAGDMVEIRLYKTNDIKVENKEFIYYMPVSDHAETKNKFNVYFYGDETRPLLFTYNDKVYVQLHNNQWYYDGSVKSSDECKILDKLNTIHENLKKKLIFVIDSRTELNINKSTGKPFDKFFKDSYTSMVDKHKEYKLSKYTLFNQDITNDTNIHKLLNKFHRLPFDYVNVYKDKQGFSLHDILLIEFVSEPQRTHLKRRDRSGKYWVEVRVDQITEENLKRELDTITKYINETIVFEIDSTNEHYSDSVQFSIENDLKTGYDKHIHKSLDSNPNMALLMYKNNQLVIKEGANYTTLEHIDYKNYSNVIVYFISDVNDDKDRYPLLIELNKSETGSVSNVYYAHRKANNNYFWEKISLFYTESSEQILIDKLDEIKYEFLDSIVILMDKKNTLYGDDQIKAAIKPTLINEFNLPELESDSISVRELDFDISCFSENGFKALGHVLNSVKNYKSCSLRFYISSSFNSDRYTELNLYSANGQKREHLYFRKGFDKVHIYFYGQDPRPLMICYADRAYKPTNLNEYLTKWYRHDKVHSCLCNYNIQNQYLVNTLTDIICSFNVVNLEHRPQTTDEKEPNLEGSEKEMYDAHDYPEVRVKIQVSYENMSCYRVYKHEPIGFGSDGSGFRLGHIRLGSETNSRLNYRLTKQLNRVSIYYNLFDVHHQYPLLVSLRYADNTYDYYELVKFPQFSWKFIEAVVDYDYVESKAYEILKKLNIELNRNEGVNTLFKRDLCKEGGTSTAAVVGGSVGGVVSTAAVTGGVTFAVRPELIITSIKALI